VTAASDEPAAAALPGPPLPGPPLPAGPASRPPAAPPGTAPDALPARDRPSGWAGRLLAGPRAGAAMWLLVAASAVVYCLFSVQLGAQMHTSAFDLGIYFEALRGYAHLGAPLVRLKGVHTNLLGDHFEPLIAALVPTYWLHPEPSTLLIDQGLLTAASIVPVWRFAARRFSARTTALLAGAYALCWELQSMLAFDFHSVALAVPLLAFAVERADADRWRAATVCALLLLFVKEDFGLVLVAFGAYAATRGRWRRGAVLAATGIAAFEITTRLVIPAFAGGPYIYWSYGELGPNLGAALLGLVRHPWTAVRLIFYPWQKAGLLAWSLLPTGLLALLSPVALLAVPLLAERVYSTRAAFWVTDFHYSAPMAPVLALATIDGLARLRDRFPARRRLAGGAALGLFTAAVAISAHFPFGWLGEGWFWSTGPNVRALRAALAVVPHQAAVAATDRLVPQLLTRDRVQLLTPDAVCAGWVVANVDVLSYPYPWRGVLDAQLGAMQAAGWRLRFRRAGIVVLQRGPGATPLGVAGCPRVDPLVAPEA
jgi:uncharacterized membrane protein